jgi:hypothetical protein
VRKDKDLPAFLVCFNQKSRVIGCEWAGKQGIIVCKTIIKKRNESGLILFNLEHESNESNSKFATSKIKDWKNLAWIGSILYLCCKKEEPACWRGKLGI